jgi:hypothetical protein
MGGLSRGGSGDEREPEFRQARIRSIDDACGTSTEGKRHRPIGREMTRQGVEIAHFAPGNGFSSERFDHKI